MAEADKPLVTLTSITGYIGAFLSELFHALREKYCKLQTVIAR